MSWRLATSLETLRDEIDDLAPRRNKASDGTIGDPAHQDRCSRHNRNYAGVVTALDITHDPAGGCDIHQIARRIAANPHPECAYIISDRMIAGRSTGWRWVSYHGSNPHQRHAHFAVGEGDDCDPRPPYDSTSPWLTLPTWITEATMLALVSNKPDKTGHVYLTDGFRKRQISAGVWNLNAWVDAGASVASDKFRRWATDKGPGVHPKGCYVLTDGELAALKNA